MADKECKFGCGVMLTWDTSINGYKEKDSGEAHTKERCAYVKSKKPATPPAPSTSGPAGPAPADRTAAIDKAHQENMEANAALVRAIIEHTKAALVKTNTEAKLLELLLAKDDRIIQLLEVMVKMLPNFLPADKQGGQQ